jgi:hypothetical protein
LLLRIGCPAAIQNVELENSINEVSDDDVNKAFSNPAQVTSGELKFQCENCEFLAARKLI